MTSSPQSERVEEILATATRLFFELGYRRVGIRMIADSVGVQPSSLYHHFSSKDEILYRIALRATTEFIDAHKTFLDDVRDVPTTLRELVREHVSYFARNRLAQQVAERELRELSPDRYQELRKRQRQWLDDLADLVARGKDEGSLQVTHPQIATRALLDMLNNFNRWFEPRRQLGVDGLANLYSEMIVDGLLGASPRSSRHVLRRPTPSRHRDRRS